MSAVMQGTKAPDFTLTAHDGEKITLTERLGRGPEILAFFPTAFSGVCTQEMCDFRDGLGEFMGMGAEVFGISVDSRYALKEFAQKHGLDFQLLSDFNKEVAGAYGVLYDDFYGLKGVAKRSVFVIDPDGMIRYSWVSDDAGVKPDIEEIKKVCEEIGD